MTNTDRSTSYSLVKTYMDRCIKPGELDGVQMRKLEEALISMNMQSVNPDFAEGFLKATGLSESYADYYRAFINFDPTYEEDELAEDEVDEIGKVHTSDTAIAEAKARGAKTAFDFIARELGVFSAEHSAEEQLKLIVDSVKDFKNAKTTGVLEFAHKLYQDCFHENAGNIPLEFIVKRFKHIAECAYKFSGFKAELDELSKKYNNHV